MNNFLHKFSSKYIFSGSIFIVVLLIIDFFPNFSCADIIFPQYAYLSAIGLVTSILIMLTKKINHNSFNIFFNKTFIVYSLFVFTCLCSLLFSKNISLSILSVNQILTIYVLVIIAYFLLNNKESYLSLFSLLISFSLLLQIILGLSSIDFFHPQTPLLIQLEMYSKGNTGNPNIYAGSLCLKIPFLLYSLSYYKKRILTFFLFLLLVSCIVYIGFIHSRTAYIHLFTIFIFSFIYFFQKEILRLKKYIKIPVLTVITLVLSIVFLCNSLLMENIVRIFNIHDTSIIRRKEYWKNALAIGREYWRSGIGIGNYRIESMPYESGLISKDMHFSLHAHNDFFEIFSETGIIGLLTFLGIFITIIYYNWKTFTSSDSSSVKKKNALLILTITIIYITDSFFNFPLYRSTFQIFFIIIIALTCINVQSKHSTKKYLIKPIPIFIGLLLVSTINLYFNYQSFRTSRLEYLIRKDNINSNAKGTLTGQYILKQYPLYPNVLITGEAFSEYVGIYFLREKKYALALKYFSEADQINPYTGRVDFYRHVVFSELGNKEAAFTSMQKAYHKRSFDFDFYTALLSLLSQRKDTVEIIKQHNHISHNRPYPFVWEKTSIALEMAGYSDQHNINLIKQGLEKFPHNKLLLKRQKAILIKNYLIHAQKFLDENNFIKAYSLLQKAIKIDPDNIFAQQNMGIWYFLNKNYYQSLHYLLPTCNSPLMSDGKSEYLISQCYKSLYGENNKYYDYLLLSASKGNQEAILCLNRK